MNIKVTVGRIVYYRASDTDIANGMCVVEGEPLAAVVAGIQSDTYLNLSVFDANGVQFPKASVRFYQDGEDVPANGVAYAHWMPYQIAKAAEKDPAFTGASTIGAMPGTIIPTV
jgi:hypothetical protein